MASKKKLKNIDEKALVATVYTKLNLSEYKWSIEIIVLSSWVGVKLNKKESSQKLDKGSHYKSQHELEETVIEMVKSGISELDGNV